MFLTSRTCAPNVLTLHFDVSTGGSTVTRTVAGRMTNSFFGATSVALWITIGTIGTPACIARWNAPFLNGSSFGVRLRVPSGAMQIDLPSF